VQVVKGYPEGKMSKHIVNLNVGDTLECKGPISKLPYTSNMKKKLGMVSHRPDANQNFSAGIVLMKTGIGSAVRLGLDPVE
jgi:hypothetical protein